MGTPFTSGLLAVVFASLVAFARVLLLPVLLLPSPLPLSFWAWVPLSAVVSGVFFAGVFEAEIC